MEYIPVLEVPSTYTVLPIRALPFRDEIYEPPGTLRLLYRPTNYTTPQTTSISSPSLLPTISSLIPTLICRYSPIPIPSKYIANHLALGSPLFRSFLGPP